MKINGAALDSIIKSGNNKAIIVLQFKTNDGKNFYADGYTYNKTAPHFVSISRILSRDTDTLTVTKLPYTLGTLIWIQDTTFDSTKPYYLIPSITTNNPITYYFSSTQISALLKPFGIPNYDAFLNLSKNNPKRKHIIAAMAAATSASFNPVPPKTVP